MQEPKPLPSLVDGGCPHFRYESDLYSHQVREWPVEDAYACFRYVTHLVNRAATHDEGKHKLASIDFTRCSREVLAMFKVALHDAWRAQSALTVGQLRIVDEVTLLTPPLVLSATPHHWPHCEKMGLIL